MDFYADVGCILKVNVHCDACKMKIHEVLRAVAGVYSVEIDSDQGLAKISGELDPNIVLAALSRNGTHAELIWMKMASPAPRGRPGYYHHRHHHHNGGSRHGYQSYDPVDYSYWARQAWPASPYPTHYSPQRPVLDYYPYDYNSNYGYPIPSYSSYNPCYYSYC